MYFFCHITEQSLTSITKESHRWSDSDKTGSDSEKKPLELIPVAEGDVKAGGEYTDLPSECGGKDMEGVKTGDVICNPDTVDRDRGGDEEYL